MLHTVHATPRPISAPHGISISAAFFGHDPALGDYKDAAKIKTIDLHPVHPWVATADEDGNVVVYDHQTEALVLSFPVTSIKDSQKLAADALELHAAFAAAQDVIIPDGAGPGLGTGGGIEPGAGAGGVTEAFLAASLAADVPRGGSGKRPPPPTAGLREDARTGKTGHVRAVRWADEHTLTWCCGSGGRSDYASADATGRLPHSHSHGTGAASASASSGGSTSGGAAATAASVPLAASLDELLCGMSYALDGTAGERRGTSSASAAAANAGSSLATAMRTPAAWLMILCDHRVLLLDYVTRAVIDIPHAALLLEAGGPTGALRTVSKGGKPGVHAGCLIGPGTFAFGCEDGAIRVWNVDSNSTIQVLRPPGGAARPMAFLHCLHTSPYITPATARNLSSASALGAAAQGATTLLVSGCVDGTVNVWEVIGGRLLADNGRGGLQQLKLGSELLELTVSPLSYQAVALTADRNVTLWDVTATTGAVGPGGCVVPRAVSSRVVTSSPAAESGLGSRLESGIHIGSHPFFAPSAMLVTGKGPHLELAIAGGSESGAIFFDLRTARPGLPQKLKVYTLQRHPLRPDTLAAGTNIGVFVLSLAPAYTASALAVTHPTWRIPASLTGEVSAEGSRIREGAVVLHASASGGLFATECTIACGATPEDASAGAGVIAATSREGGSDASGGGGDATAGIRSSVAKREAKEAAGATGVDISTKEHVLLPVFAPAMPPPAAMAPAVTNGPPPPHNALALLTPVLRSASVAPGSRGVRLRVSGSGRYLAAVWPEHKYYAIYKITLGGAAGAAGGHGGGPGPKAWSCEYIDGGSGIDVAWSGASISAFNDAYEAAASAAVRYDRFLVLEPGMQVSGRGPMGGGMAIGSSGSGGGGKGGAGGKGGGADAAAGQKIITMPGAVSLRQLPVLADASADVGKVAILVPDLAFPQEPIALFGGGPVLAAALASDTGAAVSNPQGALAASSLQFFSWTVVDPAPPAAAAEGDGGKAAAAATASRYSGATTSKPDRPKLTPIGSSSATPAPSYYGAVNGCGVSWNGDASRCAVTSPFNIHIFAVFTPRQLAAAKGGSGGKADDSAGGGGGGGGAATMLELCRVPGVATAVSWLGTTAFATLTDGRMLAVIPPALDPTVVAAGSSSSGGGVLSAHGAKLQPVVVELRGPAATAPTVPPALQADALPPTLRGMAHAPGSVPLGVFRNHLAVLQWLGPKASAAPGTAVGTILTALPLTHPGLKACIGVSRAAAGDEGITGGPTAAYVRACAAAASWGALLPPDAQSALGCHLTSLGCPAAALLLPRLSPSTVIATALRTKSDAWCTQSLRGFAAADAPIAINAVCKLLSAAGDEDVLALSTTFSRGGGVAAALDGSDLERTLNVVGVWPQVAAFLAMAMSQPHKVAAEVGGPAGQLRTALLRFVARLSALRLHRDAVAVASMLHFPDVAAAVAALQGGADSSSGSNSNANSNSSSVEANGRSAMPSSELVQLLLAQAGPDAALEAAAATI